MRQWHGKSATSISPRPTSRKLISAGHAFAAALLLYCGLSAYGAASAQSAPPQSAPVAILADGNAVVTGFSGARVTGQAANSADPADQLFIDMDGASARVVDLQDPGAPPQAQLLSAPKPFTLTAGQIGQVFGVALDNASRPNIYLAATSVYGLPIVIPAADGMQRLGLGGAGASFMPGLFGPAALQGGPGSIWRVDGVTGQVSLFANVTLDGVANSGPGLGGLAFDPASGTLFVADRETGMIHGFDRQGKEHTRFDHGVQGRQAAGLNPVPFDPAKRLDITNPQFNAEDSSTWSYAPPERRVFGLAVHAGRLYYSVADGLQVWSVAIGTDGALGSDPRLEVQAVTGNAGNEISKIAFDDQGRMLLAERAPPTGAYDFVVLAQESAGLALRLQAAQPFNASGLPISASNPDEYAIGLFDQLRNSTGGIAIGYGYTAAGLLDRGTCGGFLWTTGDELRNSADPAIAAQLAPSGPPNVDGLQGNAISLVRPANVPPLQTYFVDYSDSFGTDANRGHIGDIAIWRHCAPGFAAAQPPAEALPPPGFIAPELLPPPLPPGGFCPPSQVSITGWCCPLGTIPQPNGSCAPRRCPPGTKPLPNGSCCPLSQLTKFGFCCPPGTKPQPNGFCKRIECPPGWTPQPNGTCCPPGQQSNKGICCPPGTKPQPNGTCLPSTICPPGTTKLPNGMCCPNSQLTNKGVCCPPNEKPQPNGTCVPPPTICPPGSTMLPNGTCCPNGQLTNTGVCCPPNEKPQPNGTCAPPPTTTCPPGSTMLLNGTCCPNGQLTNTGICCPPNQKPQPNGTCVPPPTTTCPSGETLLPNGTCCPNGQLTNTGVCCPPNQQPQPNGTCLLKPPAPPACPPGETMQPNGTCCPNGQLTNTGVCCPPNQQPQPNGRCAPTTTPACPPGQTATAAGGCLCPTGRPAVNGQCLPPPPPPSLCPIGQMTESGLCCPPGTTPLTRDTCGTVQQPPPVILLPRHRGPRGLRPLPRPPREVPIIRRRPQPRVPVFHRPPLHGPVFHKPPVLRPPRVPIIRRPPPHAPAIRGRFFGR